MLLGKVYFEHFSEHFSQGANSNYRSVIHNFVLNDIGDFTKLFEVFNIKKFEIQNSNNWVQYLENSKSNVSNNF